MKKSFFLLFACCITLLLFTSCDESSNSSTKDSKSKLVTMTNTITLGRYNNWEGAWKEKGRDYMNTDSLFYFTMPLIDLSEFASLDHTAARFVLGLDTTIVPPEPHIMLVGVDSLGISMLPSSTNTTAKIFDVTVPCPKQCGILSIVKK